MSRRLMPALVALLAIASAAPGQVAGPGPAPVAVETTTSESAPVTHLLDRVATIGASASFGFDAQVIIDPITKRGTIANIGRVLDAAILRARTKTAQHASVFFYMSPLATGPRLVRAALAERPTLVVAIDYLFWFCYGRTAPHGGALRDDAERLELLEEGLRELEKIDCPIALGDLPDLTQSANLSAAQLPTPETLRLANSRIRDWAKDRENVMVVPFAELVDRMLKQEPITIGTNTWTGEESRRLLQADGLHPTAEGLVAMSALVLETVQTSRTGLLQADDVERDTARVMQRLRRDVAEELRRKANDPDK